MVLTIANTNIEMSIRMTPRPNHLDKDHILVAVFAAADEEYAA
jgi:hypothetical protein